MWMDNKIILFVCSVVLLIFCIRYGKNSATNFEKCRHGDIDHQIVFRRTVDNFAIRPRAVFGVDGMNNLIGMYFISNDRDCEKFI